MSNTTVMSHIDKDTLRLSVSRVDEENLFCLHLNGESLSLSLFVNGAQLEGINRVLPTALAKADVGNAQAPLTWEQIEWNTTQRRMDDAE